METQKIYFAVSILALVPFLALGFSFLKNKKKQLSKVIVGVVVIILVFLSLTTYFNFWKFHFIYVDSSEPGEKIELQRPFHWHETYHYYLGSKYFPELGYFGTYNCVVKADEERGRLINVDYVRNLQNVLSSISHDEALHDCEQNFKINFTSDRWDEFKNDLIFFSSIGAREWWNTAIVDAGFNPPPPSVIFSSSVSNAIPITPKTYLLFPLLDILLLTFGAWLIWRSFGIIGLCGFLVVFGISHIASYAWTGGSFLRYFWLFNLIAGMSFLQKKRYFWSGIFFGISTMLRIFPVFFALGVIVPLLFNFHKNKIIIRDFISGNVLASIFLGFFSLTIFGFEVWRDFFQNIMLHKDIYYVFHIGLKKIATFASWVPNQNFHGNSGLQLFATWNHELWAAWQEKLWFYFPLMAFITIAVFLASRKIKLIESTLLVGLTLIFLFSLPANYYYVFLALIPLALYSQKQNWRKHLVSFGLFIFLIFTWLTPLMSSDDIVQNFYTCCALAIFIIWWILLCLLPFSFLKKEI